MFPYQTPPDGFANRCYSVNAGQQNLQPYTYSPLVDPSLQRRSSSSRRPRAKFSCQNCHNRKVRCDISVKNDNLSDATSLVPCTNCKLNGTACQAFERKKMYDTKRKRQQSAQGLLRSTSGKGASDLQKNAEFAPEIFLAANLDSIALKPHNSSDNRLSKIVTRKLCPDPIFLDDYYGRTSPNVIASEQIRLDGIKSDTLKVPPLEVCWLLIDRFFDKLNYQLPIVNREAFYEQNQNLRTPSSALLLLAILFAGSRDIDSDRWSPAQLQQQQIITQRLFHKARLAYESEIETEPLCIVQTLVIFSCHAPHYTSRDAFYWIELALFTAEQYGFHVSGSPELRVVWWIAYTQYHLLHLAHVTKPNHQPIQPVAEADLKLYGLDQLQREYLVVLMRMCTMLSQAWTIPPDDSTAMKIDSLWAEWFHGLPKSLIYRIDSRAAKSVLCLVINMVHQAFLIINHRANVRRLTCDGPVAADYFPSWAVTIKSAYLISATAQNLADINELRHFLGILPQLLYISCLGYLLHINSKDLRARDIARNKINFNLHYLDSLSYKWPVANQLGYQIRRRLELRYVQPQIQIRSTPSETFDTVQLYHCFLSKSRTSIPNLIQSQESESDDFVYLSKKFELGDVFWNPQMDTSPGIELKNQRRVPNDHLSFVFW
ncbi:hypothetical protein KL930_001504 [Ogataea haglerorum]|nr:hypothetical protein KL951_001990 [Ogataea haglerorum]KAG7725975.1 hypothetical protein KL948_004710 [Ogataea haglerorum]KAG7765183.1 hypothetical protein KL931_004487 [Ogataea haglerorum]KAG7780579.1 hypothetical protein KL922_000930 [Ogataea haglerorum]KAG7782008.1 hypothetical protein KL930_001504 [Ogataea haglerorum]